MSWAKNDVVAPDAYTIAATLDGLPAVRRATIDVVNQPVFIQVKQITGSYAGAAEGQATWGTEERLLPGSKNLARAGIVGIRWRAAIPAAQVPAGQVQAHVTVTVPG